MALPTHGYYCFEVINARLTRGEAFLPTDFDDAEEFAFKDRRFSPITAKELPKLECGVSLLTDFELCESYLDWTLNTHGIYISLPNPALTPPSSTPSSSSSSSSLPLSSSTPRATYRSISHLPAFVPAAYPNPRRLPTVLSATYLPDVPGAQGWTKIEAVDSAIRKAGWSGRITEETRGSMRVTRYQSKKVEVRYEEWRAWRETVDV